MKVKKHQEKMYSIADLHCDLLLYLQGAPERTPYDLEARCAIPQLLSGNVKTQIMAVFTETAPGSSRKGYEQIKIFKSLLQHYPQIFKPIHQSQEDEKIAIALAIENASGLVDEMESLENGFQQIERIESEAGKIVYLCMTWNQQNRFGGGAHSKVGLKEDGERLLDFLDRKRIAIDLSHASDALACDILNAIDKKQLIIPVIASHSNFRAITNVPRNLPDELAQEIIRRKGIIGLNFVREFVGEKTPLNFIKQLEHMLKLGGEKQYCFGADFFYPGDLPPAYYKPKEKQFFPGFDEASAYPKIFQLWKQHACIAEPIWQGIAQQNFWNFLNSNIL